MAASASQDGGQRDEEQANHLREALETCSRICNDPDTMRRVEAKWPELQPFCERHPTCSLGVLFWARALLTQHDFLTSHAFPQSFLIISKIAQTAADKHALQRSYAFAVLKRALETRPPADDDAIAGGSYLSDARLAELSENVIDAMVDLMSRGFVMPVLDHFIQHAPTLDLSLLRKFLTGLLEVSQQPYSKTFKDKLGSLLDSPPGIKAGLGGGQRFQELKDEFYRGEVRS